MGELASPPYSTLCICTYRSMGPHYMHLYNWYNNQLSGSHSPSHRPPLKKKTGASCRIWDNIILCESCWTKNCEESVLFARPSYYFYSAARRSNSHSNSFLGSCSGGDHPFIILARLRTKTKLTTHER